MVRAAFGIMGTLLLVGTLAAQGHDNTKETTAKAAISIAAPWRVGTVTLSPGEYRIVCDRDQVKFTRTADGKVFQFPCKGRELDKKSEETVTLTTLDKNGVRYLAKLLIRGSIVEHIFD
jgi:hypothetical protein